MSRHTNFFTFEIQPWFASGFGPGGVSSLSVTSETLKVIALGGSAFQVELVNSYSVVAYAATLDTAAYSNNKVTMTGAMTIAPPSSPVDGAVVNFRILASGGNQNLSLDPSIDVPTSSTFTSPQVIVNGKKCRLTLQYDGDAAAWQLIQFINGY